MSNYTQYHLTDTQRRMEQGLFLNYPVIPCGSIIGVYLYSYIYRDNEITDLVITLDTIKMDILY